jgi:hypothetical protein
VSIGSKSTTLARSTGVGGNVRQGRVAAWSLDEHRRLDSGRFFDLFHEPSRLIQMGPMYLCCTGHPSCWQFNFLARSHQGRSCIGHATCSTILHDLETRMKFGMPSVKQPIAPKRGTSSGILVLSVMYHFHRLTPPFIAACVPLGSCQSFQREGPYPSDLARLSRKKLAYYLLLCPCLFCQSWRESQSCYRFDV